MLNPVPPLTATPVYASVGKTKYATGYWVERDGSDLTLHVDGLVGTAKVLESFLTDYAEGRVRTNGSVVNWSDLLGKARMDVMVYGEDFARPGTYESPTHEVFMAHYLLLKVDPPTLPFHGHSFRGWVLLDAAKARPWEPVHLKEAVVASIAYEPSTPPETF